MTTIYLTRHSIPDKNQKLTREGVIKAIDFLKNNEFNDVSHIYTSNFDRTKETGLILNKGIIIDNRLGERIAGTPDTNITKNEYYYRQMIDENYKFPNGESRLEIQNRMYSSIMDIVKNNKDEKILVISHGAAMTFLLMKFCDVEMIDISNKIRRIEFNDKIIFENKFDYLETFKLTFDEYELVSIESVGNINGYIQYKGKTRIYRRCC